jgi:hypothetical protein
MIERDESSDRRGAMSERRPDEENRVFFGKGGLILSAARPPRENQPFEQYFEEEELQAALKASFEESQARAAQRE